MALSLDDKLLGEKAQYYCSSSEDEGIDNEEESGSKSEPAKSSFIPEEALKEYQGHCTNTGPKGVVQDWRRYKQLEAEKREAQEREKLDLAKKLTLTCRSQLDDERDKERDEAFMSQIEKELEDFEDDFLKEYRQKRIEEMRKAVKNLPKFGKLISLTSEEFVDAVDKENPMVTIIVHVYDEKVTACEAMNGCLTCLAYEYPIVKFCKIKATDAKMTAKFAKEGVPALLIYKSKELIANFVRMSDEFGDDFYASDIESFLLEHGLLPDQTPVKAIINPDAEASDDDSDLGPD